VTVAADWSGRVGEVWAEEWSRTERAFSGLAPVLEQAILAVAPERGRFLDIGCGIGATSRAVASARPDAQVIGVDLAAGMVGVARMRAAGQANLSFLCADAVATARADGPFDLLFSRHGVMFFDDPAAAFSSLRAAATPGARLVFSCFQHPDRNPWASRLVEQVTGATAPRPTGYAPGPFGFADDAFVRTLLDGAGWSQLMNERVDFAYVAGEGADPVADATAFFSRIGPVSAAMRLAPEPERATLRDRLLRALGEHSSGDRITFPAAAWIWTAQA
jgi:SAM-dependent methyltransferase